MALSGLLDHRSGDGVSVLPYPDNVAGLEEAADSGRGMGLNSVALALSSLGEEIGDAGRLAVNWTWAWVTWECASTGEFMGETLRAVIYDDALPLTSGDVTGVCGLRNPITNGEFGTEEGVSGLLGRTE